MDYKENKTTIVSVYINNVNQRPDRSLNDYIKYGEVLLKAKIPKIIFVDSESYEIIKDYENENTKIFAIEKTDVYLYEYIDKLENFNLYTSYPEKDTIEYMFTMCSKTEWIKKAIELNIFNSINYIWMDFSIRHIFRCDDDTFIAKVENLNEKFYDLIRIASIWNSNTQYNVDIYRSITWYFAGGVFGGYKENLLQFSDIMKEYCLKIMNEQKLLMWEVNIWYLIYLDYPHLFHCYPCDHNDTILDHY